MAANSLMLFNNLKSAIYIPSKKHTWMGKAQGTLEWKRTHWPD
jgi:hypothetical protein